MPFPYIEVSGTPYRMGREHGRQAATQIHGFVQHLVNCSGRSRVEVLTAAGRFRPLFERYCPLLVEEICGVADGAEIPFEEALLLQIRGEASPLLAERACTTFAIAPTASATGALLIGQTSDMEPELEPFFVVLHLHPDSGPRTLMWTFAGQLGYHGLNEYGVAHFANSVWGGPAPAARPARGINFPPYGLPHYPIKRRLYESRTRQEFEAVWAALPVVSSGNYMVATGEPAIFDLEATPAGFTVLEPVDGVLAHANHFLSSRFRTAETDAASLPDSFIRQEQMTRLLQERVGELTVEAVREILADHEGHPCGICRHEETDVRRMATVAGLIAEPQAGRFHVARGNPCRGDWTTYTL